MRIMLTIFAALALLGEGACNDAGATPVTDSSPSALVGDPKLARGTAASGQRLQTLAIVDAQGFDHPMRFATIMVPAGWAARGGIDWDRSTPCVTNQMKLHWSATAADGITGILFMPGFGWQTPQAANRMNPCPVAAIGSARDFLEMVARSTRSGSRVMGYLGRPDLMPAEGSSTGSHLDVGTLLIAYETEGRLVEEALTAFVSLNPAFGSTDQVFGYRAPAGKLDMAAVEAVRKSFRVDPDYRQAYVRAGSTAANAFAARQSNAITVWHNGRMADINARGAADRAAIRAQGDADTRAIYARTAADTSATNDRIYAANRRSLQEETTWTNPSTGGTVQGSIHGGRRVLQFDDGSIARTDDPYLDPAGSTALDPQ